MIDDLEPYEDYLDRITAEKFDTRQATDYGPRSGWPRLAAKGTQTRFSRAGNIVLHRLPQVMLPRLLCAMAADSPVVKHESGYGYCVSMQNLSVLLLSTGIHPRPCTIH